MWPGVLEQMQLSRPSALWCLNWSIITNVTWLMASFANLHLSNIQRVRIEKNRTFFFEFLTLIILHYYQKPFGNEKKVFAHLPFILFAHSDFHKAQPSYVCVLRSLPYLPCSCLLGISLWLVLKEKEW